MKTQLMSALKILNFGSQNFVGKIKFIMKSQIKANSALNKLDYKMVRITNTELSIYHSPNQFEKNVNSDIGTMNISNYLITIKLKNIDLPCNDYLYLCTIGELLKEYSNKMPDVDFNTKIFGQFNKAGTNCIVLSLGDFNSLDELGYLCFDNLEHMVFIQNLLTERILKLQSEYYSGVVELLSNDRNKLHRGILELKDTFMTYAVKKQSLNIKYTDIKSYAITLFKHENVPWTGNVMFKPDPLRCFKIQTTSGNNLYFFNYHARNELASNRILTASNSIFVNNIFVARINLKLHNYQLKLVQNKMKKIPKLECDSIEMAPIKYEIRMKVNINFVIYSI
jgi:hypothetical protein